MDTRAAEYVIAVQQTGNMTKAAQSMYISQPALSQAIGRLEEELGTKIFVRHNGKMQLTYAGEKYLEAMKKMIAITGDLRNELSDIAGDVSGRMRLGISLQRSMQLLPVVLPTFFNSHPQVRVILEEHGSGTLEKMLHDGKCDIALITTTPHYEDIEYLLLETEEVLLMAAKDTQIARGFPDGSDVSILDAKNESFVALDHGHSVRVVQDRLFMETGLMPHIILETENLEAAKRFAAAGRAVMLCPDVFITQSPEVRRQVHCYRVRELSFKRHFYFAYRKDMYFAGFMRDFLDILRKALEGFSFERR